MTYEEAYSKAHDIFSLVDKADKIGNVFEYDDMWVFEEMNESDKVCYGGLVIVVKKDEPSEPIVVTFQNHKQFDFNRERKVVA